MKGLRVTKIDKEIKFEGVWAELEAKSVSRDNHSQGNWESLDIFLIIPNFLTSKSFFFLCGHLGPPSGENAVVFLQFLRQLSYTMFVNNNRASFHLWWKENLVKYREDSNYYENDSLQNFVLLFLSLLTAPTVKNSHT